MNENKAGSRAKNAYWRVLHFKGVVRFQSETKRGEGANQAVICGKGIPGQGTTNAKALRWGGGGERQQGGQCGWTQAECYSFCNPKEKALSLSHTDLGLNLAWLLKSPIPWTLLSPHLHTVNHKG